MIPFQHPCNTVPAPVQYRSSTRAIPFQHPQSVPAKQAWNPRQYLFSAVPENMPNRFLIFLNPERSANCAPGQGLSLVCFICDLERQEGRLRRIPSLKTPSLRVRLPARIRNAAPPSVGERGADFGKTGRENRHRNALRSKPIFSPFRPPLGEASKEQIFHSSTMHHF